MCDEEFMNELSKRVCADPKMLEKVRGLKKWILNKRKKNKIEYCS